MNGQNKRVGIIGLGWLGEPLGIKMQESGFSVWGTVRAEEKAEKLRKKGLEVTIWQSTKSFSTELKEFLGKTDYLILNLPPSSFSEISYAAGLASFLQFISNKTKVIFTSSTGVYPNELLDAREDYVFKPHESNKLVEAENVLQQQLENRLCILRLAGLIGDDRNPVFYLAKKEINQDPDKKVNLIHQKDIIQIIHKVIIGNHFGEIFNVCHPDHPTRKAYYTKMAQHFKLSDIQFTESANKVTNKIVNCSKLQVTLDYSEFENLDLTNKTIS